MTDVTLNGTTYQAPESGEADWGVALNQYLRALSAAQSGFLFFAAGLGVDASETVWLYPGWNSGVAGSAPINIPLPCAGRIAAMAFDVGSVETGGTITATVLKNDVATSLVSVRVVGSTGVAVVTDGFSVQAGDRIAVQVVGGPGVSQEPNSVTLILQPSSSATP